MLSGGVDATGAARLAARAALRIGAGLVTVASPASALLVNAAALEAVMVRRADDAAGVATLLEDGRLNAVVAGPGLAPGRRPGGRSNRFSASGALPCSTQERSPPSKRSRKGSSTPSPAPRRRSPSRRTRAS